MFSASGRTEKETFLNGSRKNTGIVLSKLLSLVLPPNRGAASLPRTFHALPILCRWPMGRYAGSSIPGNYGRKDKKRARSPKIMPVLDSLKKAATLLCRLPLAAAAHGHGGPCALHDEAEQFLRGHVVAGGDIDEDALRLRLALEIGLAHLLQDQVTI